MKTNFSTVKATDRTDVYEGILKISLSGADGHRRPYFEQKNVITLTSKQQVLSSIYVANLMSDPITALRVGVGGCIDEQGLFPKPVDQEMQSLFQESLSVNTTFIETLTTPSVTFLADLDQGQGNGLLINEAGLFKQSNTMFNIKTFPAITKTSEFNIHFEWTIRMG